MSVTPSGLAIARWYEVQRQGWVTDGSALHNVGLWAASSGAAHSHVSAQQALVSAVLTGVDTSASSVLDVGCGPGGTTYAAAAQCPSAQILGIDLALPPDLRGDERVTFATADACALPVADGTVDALVCIEAAQHFDSRSDFLIEALRVLRPGGSLHVTDLLVGSGSPLWAFLVPPANHGLTPQGYASLLQDIGFSDVEVDDITDITWRPYWDRVGSTVPGGPSDEMVPVTAYVHVRARRPS